MKRLSLLLVFLLIFAVNITALAQEGEEKDLFEVNLYGGMGIPSGSISDWNDSLGAKMGWDIGFDFGYFIKPNITLGINFVYTEFGVDADNVASELNHRLYNPNFYIKYYFEGESNLVPYLKGHLGIENPKFATFVSNEEGNRYREKSYDPCFAYGFGAGLFYYTADYSGLFLEINYHGASSESAKANYSGIEYEFGENIGVIDIHAGIRILISSGE